MTPRARPLTALLAACLLAAPAFGAPMRAPGIERLAGGALLLMPLRVEIYEVAPGGLALLRPEWTSEAREHVRTGLESLLGSAVLVRYEAPDDPERAGRHAQVRRVQRLVQQTVVTHHYQPAMSLPTKRERLDWSLGPGAAILGDVTPGARWALFLELTDRRLSDHFVRFGSLGDELVATASLVDLTTGNLVWLNHERGGGVRTPPDALATLRRLLRELPL